MKSKEELNALKEEVENVNRKLHELSEEELEQVNGGSLVPRDVLVFETAVSETTVASALRPR